MAPTELTPCWIVGSAVSGDSLLIATACDKQRRLVQRSRDAPEVGPVPLPFGALQIAKDGTQGSTLMQVIREFTNLAYNDNFGRITDSKAATHAVPVTV